MLFQAEQKGGNLRSFTQMEAFRECLADCGLADLGFSGYPFTWDNKRDDDENIQVRLDRATCNDDFIQMFPETTVDHILTEESDHAALVIHALVTPVTGSSRMHRGFRFEEAWTRHELYDGMVMDAWHAADHGQSGLQAVCTKLDAVTKDMQRWSRDVFVSIKKQIGKLKGQLRDAKERALNTGYM